MLAHIYQYQHEQVEEGNRTAGESQTEDSVTKMQRNTSARA